jgi:hypothetical protein
MTHLHRRQMDSPVLHVVILSLLIRAAAASVGCTTDLPEPSSAVRAAPSCGAPSADDYYFPRDIFFPARVEDPQSISRPSRVLADLHEPSLSCGDGAPEAYRVLWIHSFSVWNPAMVRISRAGSGWLAVAVRSKWDRIGATPHLTEVEHREAVLDAEQGNQIVRALKAAEFWVAPHSVPTPSMEDGGLWLLEGRRGSGYHVVCRLGGTDPGLCHGHLSPFAEVGRVGKS